MKSKHLFNSLLYFIKYFYLCNPFRCRKINQEQIKFIHSIPQNIKQAIVFIVPGFDIVNGGVLSIFSLAEETRKLFKNSEKMVFLCSMPGEPPILRFTKFQNRFRVVSFECFLKNTMRFDNLLVHLPENRVNKIVQYIDHYHPLLSKMTIAFNILLQNINLAPLKTNIDYLKKIGKVSCTTAHEAYTNKITEERLGIEIQKMSVYVSPEQYENVTFENKKDQIVVSPDKDPNKKRILNKIKECEYACKLIQVNNMTYDNYKKLLSGSKWALTFGEGLDGYFVETVFSGGIAFAVYNTNFFTSDFKDLETVYSSFDEMNNKIVEDLTRLNNKASFCEYQKRQFDLCAKYYKYSEYVANIKMFYSM